MNQFSAYFYTLVSLDTEEVKYADQRQQHLVDQGFFFEIVQEFVKMNYYITRLHWELYFEGSFLIVTQKRLTSDG